MTILIMKELLPEGGTEEELESIDVLNGITDVYPPVFLHDFRGRSSESTGTCISPETDGEQCALCISYVWR